MNPSFNHRQPNNRALRAALSRAYTEPSRDSVDALAAFRNRRTTWCGLEELQLRAAIDDAVREFDSWYYL